MRKTRRWSTWLVLLGALVACGLFVVVRLGAPSDGARISFYADAWTTDGVHIDPIDTPANGLESGDLIQAVDGRPIDAWLRDALNPAAPRPEGAATYQLVRDGSSILTGVVWAPQAFTGTLVAGWSVVLFSVATAGLAGWVFRRRPDEPAAAALMFAAAGVAGSSVPWFLGATVSDIVAGAPFVLHAVVTGPLYMLLWPAGIHMALVFPTPSPLVRRHRWLIPGVYALVLGAYALATLAAAVASPTAIEWVASWPVAQVAVVVPALAAAAALFVGRYLKNADSTSRARARLATLGIVVTAVLGLVTFMLPALVAGEPLLPVAAIGVVSLPMPIGLAFAIVHDRLFDIEVAINRALVFAALTVGVLATYAVAVAGLTFVVGEQGYGVSLLATGVAALVALPLRDGLQRTVNRLLYGQRDEPWQVMRRLGMRLEWATDPARAFPVVVETLADALRLPYVGLEVSDDVGRTAVVAEHGTPVPETETLPLVHGGDHVGRLVLGRRRGERSFADAELALLHDLARQAGAAIHAQRLRDELARSRERLVAAREEERRRLRRDLHDGLGPALAAIAMRSEAASSLMGDRPQDARRELETIGSEIRGVIADLRRLVDGLRPPSLDQLGLVEAIREQGERLGGGGTARAGQVIPTISVEASPDPLPDLPAAVEVAAYRIVVEAVTNVVRHAEARTCCVRIAVADGLSIEVADDGRGGAVGERQDGSSGMPDDVGSEGSDDAPRRRTGTGLESMRERAEEVGGELSVESIPGAGTTVRARLPLGRVAVS